MKNQGLTRVWFEISTMGAIGRYKKKIYSSISYSDILRFSFYLIQHCGIWESEIQIEGKRKFNNRVESTFKENQESRSLGEKQC